MRAILGPRRTARRGRAGRRDADFHPRTTARPGRVDRPARCSRTGPPPPADDPLVMQVSRWDRLKDPIGRDDGVRRARASDDNRRAPRAGRAERERRRRRPRGRARCSTRSRRPGERCRRRSAAGCIWPACRWPTSTRTRRSSTRSSGTPTVIVQKSLQEGFGLTVAEAMWKARPVVASAVGGIKDQIVDGETGVLLGTRTISRAFGEAVLAAAGRPRAARAARAQRTRARAPALPGRTATRASTWSCWSRSSRRRLAGPSPRRGDACSQGGDVTGRRLECGARLAEALRELGLTGVLRTRGGPLHRRQELAERLPLCLFGARPQGPSIPQMRRTVCRRT